MKRNEIVESLLKEGFSEKTLVKFTDKQLSNLHERIVGEADIMISKKDPQAQQKIVDAKKQNKTIETYESDLSSNISKKKKTVKKKTKKNSEIKEWLTTLAEENFHSFTSKGEIMELIQTKMDTNVGSKVKKGHNGIPEFMTYDSITQTDVKENGPLTKPAPTKPKVVPGTKPKTPYQPGPGTNPKPKAMGKVEVKENGPLTKPAPTKPKVNPGTKPKTPYQPGPGKNPKPKALKEKEIKNGNK